VQVTSYPTFEDWRARAHAFETLAAARVWRPTLRTPDGPVRLQGAEVSLDFFPTLGVVPELGRLLQPEDFRPDAVPVVVLGQRLWRQRFGADPSVLGRAVLLEGAPRTIVGVLRADTPLSEPIVSQDAELAKPLLRSPSLVRGHRFFRVTGRLRPGISVEQASSEMRRLSLALAREHPETNGDWTALAGSFQAMRPAAGGLMGLHEFSVGPSPIDSLAAAFHRTGIPLGLLDLRRCPTTGPTGAWLTSPHAVREAGGFFLDETQLWMLPTVISERFDALIYFDRESGHGI
jgi:hypothetical protein